MTIDDLLADPDWLPHRLSGDGATIAFRHTPREAQRVATFLDDESLGEGRVVNVPVAALGDVAATRPLHFVFHSAFCCSTLLARALDVPGVAMGLKEPAILNDLAAQARAGRSPAALAPALSLLARPYDRGGSNVAKPSNVANVLIDPILAARPETRALLLYAPLRVFLASVAKKGMWGRIWMRRFYRLVAQAPGFAPGFSDTELFEQTDLQIAGLAWLQQQAQFAAVVRRHGARIATLDSETLLASRDAVLPALGIHLGIALEQATPAVFGEHAKRLGESYDADTRDREAAASEAAHGEELDMVTRWATAIAQQFAIPLTLDRALL